MIRGLIDQSMDVRARVRDMVRVRKRPPFPPFLSQVSPLCISAYTYMPSYTCIYRAASEYMSNTVPIHVLPNTQLNTSCNLSTTWRGKT